MTIAVAPPLSAPAEGAARPHALVIGAGFGGLAAGVRLAAKGYRVTVLEKLDQPGGRAYVFRQDGFTFDAGPTIITVPHLFEELWTLCGQSMADDCDVRPLSPFYRIVFDDRTHVDCSADADAMRAQVAAIAPRDVAGFDAFMKKSEAIYRVAFEKYGFVPFNHATDMLAAIPSLLRTGGVDTVYSLVARYVRDPKIRIMLSFHPLFIGANPVTTTSLYALIAYLEQRFGVHFAMGGMGTMVAGLHKLLVRQGGQLRCKAEVKRILLDGRRAVGVELSGGERIAADLVIANADSATLYGRLLPDLPRKRWSARKLRRTSFSMSVFVWHFGTNRRYDDVRHHTIVLGPRYRELLRDIFLRKHLAEDFSLYLYRPTATDPSLAPAGCDAFYVLSPVPNLLGDTDWTLMAEPYRQAIERRLEERLLPGLAKAVVSSRVTTPLDFRDRLNSMHGAAFGIEPLMLQSAWFRPTNRSEDVKNLYLVGAGTHPGAGVSGVLMSARIIDGLLPHASAFTRG